MGLGMRNPPSSRLVRGAAVAEVRRTRCTSLCDEGEGIVGDAIGLGEECRNLRMGVPKSCFVVQLRLACCEGDGVQVCCCIPVK